MEFEFALIGLCCLWPAELPGLQPFTRDPEAGAVKMQYLDPGAGFVGENEDGSFLGFLFKMIRCDGIKAVKTLAHIARFKANEYVDG